LKLTSLKAKVLLWFVGSISLVLLVFNFALYYFINENINLKYRTRLELIAHNIYAGLEEKSLNKEISQVKNINIALLKKNKLIKKTPNFDISTFHEYLKEKKIYFFQELDEENIRVVYVYKFKTPYDGAIIISSKELPNKIEEVTSVLFILNPILLLILILIGVRFFNKILAPIKNITQIAKKISIDNFSHAMNINGQEDELQELAQTFNLMIDRLQEGVNRLDRFNNDVSHELRTPLTVINTQIELAQKKDRDIDYYKDSLHKISQESNKIKKIVENLLLLSRYSKENIEATFELCDLNSILMDSVEKFHDFIAKKRLVVEFKRFEKAQNRVNPSLIAVLFSNVIENAIKYTPEDKKIFISLFEEDHKVYFIVQDEGIGIPEESLDKVTDRFYRVDESRNKKIKGFGLGLSLVKSIVELHSGSLSIKSKISEGTTILIQLTKANALF
jgi:signal transduction histidine kinase